MPLPKISVVVPSYNQGLFIEETLLSILGQGYPNLEVLVIDGGSTDQTVEVLNKYEDRLTYWHSRPDQGQADAINQGMALSTGDVVCWLNSDDVYLPGTLLAVGRRLADKTDRPYLLYGSAAALYQDEERFTGMESLMAEPFQPERLTYCDYIQQPSAFWTRALWLAVGELNTAYHYVLDWDWFIRASQVCEFEFVSRCFALYRYHANHKTSTGGQKRRQEVVAVVRQFGTTYWAGLYDLMERQFPTLLWLLGVLVRLRMPQMYWVLPLFFPEILWHLRRRKDFLTGWLMLG